MFSGYREAQELPRVIHISIARYHRHLPQPGEPLTFLVSIHEEGTGVTWQQNVQVSLEQEQDLVDAVHALHLWSLDLANTPEQAWELVDMIGEQLFDIFIKPAGWGVLQNLAPTAVLLDVDETILNLPWELIRWPDGPVILQEPFGRLVTTRVPLQPGRDPLQEDAVVRFLVVANPTSDLGITESTIATLTELEGNHGPFRVEVDVLAEDKATVANFLKKLEGSDFDILHFAGHAYLHPDQPGHSALRFADGDLTADEVVALTEVWEKAPYFVFNSACESARGVRGLRLVSQDNQGNGLAAAFLATGVYGYAGYFWPVTNSGAGMFMSTFYRAMFMLENVGLAYLEARRRVAGELPVEEGDLTAYSAVLYGDAASKHRRDIYTAA